MNADSTERRAAAANRFMATQPVLEGMVRQIVDSADLPMAAEQREQLLAAVSTRGWMEIFEGKIRAALTRFLTAPEIEALTRYFASQPADLRSALQKWAFAQHWAAVEIGDYVEQKYEELFEREHGGQA